MFSWWKVLSAIRPPWKVIIVCISSSKPAFGMPTSTPSEVNGNGPLNCAWKSVMSCCWSITVLFCALRASVSALAWAS